MDNIKNFLFFDMKLILAPPQKVPRQKYLPLDGIYYTPCLEPCPHPLNVAMFPISIHKKNLKTIYGAFPQI